MRRRSRPSGGRAAIEDAGAAPDEVRRLVADRGDAGQRVDRVLLRRLADVPGVSRTRVQRWIDHGRVHVGGRVAAKPSAHVAFGDEILVTLPPQPSRSAPAAEAHDLAVLHEDDHVLVVDKPAGVVSHPAYKHARGTVLNALLWRGKTDRVPWTPRLVHRLDRDTSGVLLVAKDVQAHRALLAAWRDHGARKVYLAIVWGRPSKKRGEIRLKLDRDPVDSRRVLASPVRGRDSLTRYEWLASSRGVRAGVSLVACEIVTGRMHQIRVHLAAAGLPIVGDTVYGPSRLPPSVDTRLASAIAKVGRHALHAWRLRVPHPLGDAAIDVTAPLPDDMRELLETTGIDARAALQRTAASLDARPVRQH